MKSESRNDGQPEKSIYTPPPTHTHKSSYAGGIKVLRTEWQNDEVSETESSIHPSNTSYAGAIIIMKLFSACLITYAAQL